MSLARATEVAHSLSKPSKMPWFGYSLPAETCAFGSLLRSKAGSVCSKCYALKGRYVFDNVLRAMWLRLASLTDPEWVDAMVSLIDMKYKRSRRQSRKGYFRWHDSGDLQGVWHLEKIVEVCRRTPQVKHWLPTREIGMIREYVNSGGVLPDNLVVRVSAPNINHLPDNLTRLGLPVSTVGLTDSRVITCEAYTRGGACGDCRICWSKADVNYPLH